MLNSQGGSMAFCQKINRVKILVSMSWTGLTQRDGQEANTSTASPFSGLSVRTC